MTLQTKSSGNQYLPTTDKKKCPISDLNAPSERQEQIWLAKYLTIRKIPFYHVPNGGYRPSKNIQGRMVPLEAKLLKLMGVQAGIPDICIPVKTEQYGALYIELKRKNGHEKNLTKNQIYWLDKLRNSGNRAEVAFGWVDAIVIVNEYLSLKIN